PSFPPHVSSRGGSPHLRRSRSIRLLQSSYLPHISPLHNDLPIANCLPQPRSAAHSRSHHLPPRHSCLLVHRRQSHSPERLQNRCSHRRFEHLQLQNGLLVRLSCSIRLHVQRGRGPSRCRGYRLRDRRHAHRNLVPSLARPRRVLIYRSPLEELPYPLLTEPIDNGQITRVNER
ncbi:hypothetical protein PFISCL1PPCAC_19230, partial [Pristionchus fissidentatus]